MTKKNSHEGNMLISEVSEILGITPRAIRLYEQMGLVSAPQRSEGGMRYYGKQDIKRFKFILDLKMLGISLAEMQELAKHHRMIDTDGEVFAPLLTELIDKHLESIKQKIAVLESLQADIEEFQEKLMVACPAVTTKCC